MKKFETVRKLSNVGRILSKIVFICSIICTCVLVLATTLNIVGILGVNYGDIMSLIASALGKDTSMAQNFGVWIIAVLIAVLIGLVGHMIIAKHAENYFKKVIADGTPFNEDNSKRLFKLGMILIVVSLTTSIIIRVVSDLLLLNIGGNFNMSFLLPSDVILGGLFIFMSYICKYGAEVIAERTETVEEAENNNEIEE